MLLLLVQCCNCHRFFGELITIFSDFVIVFAKSERIMLLVVEECNVISRDATVFCECYKFSLKVKLLRAVLLFVAVVLRFYFLYLNGTMRILNFTLFVGPAQLFVWEPFQRCLKSLFFCRAPF